MSLHGKKEALIKILYHGYLQAILQQERIEGACFHKRASQGVTHNQCDVKAVVHWREGGGVCMSRESSAGLENITKVQSRVSDSASPLTVEGTQVLNSAALETEII